MRKIVFALLAVAAFAGGTFSGGAQTRRHTVMFYNVENVFDTINTPGVRDDEFTPEGPKAWNSTKYWKKMANLEKVFTSIAKDVKQFPTVIGVSAIENRNVLEDMAAMPKMQQANYQIVHYDGPDARGVDVAFFYRPDQFRYEGSKSEKTVVESRPDFRTRDILTMWGTIDGERFMFMVAHWPSRTGGQAQSEYLRVGAAKTMRRIADSVLVARPDTKIIMMGDLNDDPTDVSVAQHLGGKLNMKDVRKAADLYNPFAQLHKDGYGSLAYQDAWNLFDNIIVNGNLVDGSKGYQLWKPNNSKYYGFIYDKSWLKQSSGQYKGYPWRTYVGNNFQNGYSDHFPVYVYIAR